MPLSHSSRQKDARGRPRFFAGSIKLFLVLALTLSFVAFASVRNHGQPPRRAENLHQARSLTLSARPDAHSEDLCNLVRTAADQCSWVRKHCPTDEGGFSTILDIFYCRLPHLKWGLLVGIGLWLGLLFAAIGITASDFFCIDLSAVAKILGMSEALTGVTFLAFGNGSPDVFSTFAAMGTGSGSLAAGELFGAAGFITTVVAASMALVRPFHVPRKSFIRDVGSFTIAAAFSLVFLWDGKLHLWETIGLVIYYLLYVAFVCAWHWIADRRRLRRAKEAAARGHFALPDDEHEVEYEAYQDDPEAGTEAHGPKPSRGGSWEDWNALEGQTGNESDVDEDAEEHARDRWMSELTSNMRIARPNARSRKNTIATPVRPSLVGALEFQSVLKSLQRSRNIQTIPLDSRRYSDDPRYTTLQQQDHMSAAADSTARPSYQVHVTDESSPLLGPNSANATALQTGPSGRTRAVSVNDAAVTRIDQSAPRLAPIRSEEDLIDMSSDNTGGPMARVRSRSYLDVPLSGLESHQTSPSLRLEPATPQRDSPLRDVIHTNSSHASSAHLAPPDAVTSNRLTSDYFVQPNRVTDSPRELPRAVPRADKLPHIVIPPRNRSRSSSRATSPFPAYRDNPSPSISAGTRSPMSMEAPSLQLPPAMASPESVPDDQDVEHDIQRRPSKLHRIWPYAMLAPPDVIGSTLFPAFCDWRDKGWLGKLVAVSSAPIVLVLTLSLPVVEDEADLDDVPLTTNPSKTSSWESATQYMSDTTNIQHRGRVANNATNLESTATIAVQTEERRRREEADAEPHAPPLGRPYISSAIVEGGVSEDPPELWNRWLTIIQLFVAPQVICFACWIQAPGNSGLSWLIRPMLISLLVSLILLIPLLWTTTPTYRPRVYRVILSLVGFAVAIAWISAIASQVVGALKALAVILNISHAIMGLTIFAVGNSLGDLVADYTVAKLGYPVMALSACFGGPMLNILLGIGLAGTYNLVRIAEKHRHKHPDKGLHLKPFPIEVSQTLLVSGATLLITLIGLLIAVPLNKWVFDRKIAWTLIALWLVSTTVNVCIEVFGLHWGNEVFSP